MQTLDALVAGPLEALGWLETLEQAGTRHVLEHDGVSVVWRRFGQGPAVAMLHGGHGSWLHWARNIEALAQHHTVWVVDLPGYGDSDVPSPVEMAGLVQATQVTLDALVGADTPVALIGFSFGGLVSAQVAKRRTGVTALALLGPGGHGGPRRPIGELRSWRRAASDGDTALLGATMRHNLMMHMLHAPGALDDAATHIHTVSCRRTRFASKPISHAGGLLPLLTAPSGPLLMAWGEHDVTTDPAWVMQAVQAQQIPAQTVLLPGAGHWVQYEAADAVNNLLLTWLSQVHSA
jgi:pimeloyl-ACP methyl ester carboxylesterase